VLAGQPFHTFQLGRQRVFDEPISEVLAYAGRVGTSKTEPSTRAVNESIASLSAFLGVHRRPASMGRPNSIAGKKIPLAADERR
jgi:hypothetical protein